MKNVLTNFSYLYLIENEEHDLSSMSSQPFFSLTLSALSLGGAKWKKLLFR